MIRCILLLAIVVGCISCKTKDLTFEIRLKKPGAKISGVHLVSPSSIHSFGSKLIPDGEGETYVFYSFSGLLTGGTQKVFLVVDFDETENQYAPSEVYHLGRYNLKIREDWSEWLAPHYTDTALLTEVHFNILRNMKEATTRSSNMKMKSSFRYKLQPWSLE